MDGIVNLLKPPGMTSFDAVAIMRRLTQTRKIGHTGTLDPDAAGVLPICIGRATKAVEYLTEKEKTYRVEMILGMETDTQDSAGAVIREQVPNLSDTEIHRVCMEYVGVIRQIPPMYSAVKVNGQRLYDIARSGRVVEREARQVNILQLQLLQVTRLETTILVRMDVTCSKGTYIRTLCHDIGQQLGCGGHMSFLLRTASGPFALEDAVTLETLAQAAEKNEITRYLLPVDMAFQQLQPLEVSDVFALSNGQAIAAPQNTCANQLYRVYAENSFLGLGALQLEGQFKMVKWMGEPILQQRIRNEDSTC